MEINHLHPLRVTVKEALAIQLKLREKIILEDQEPTSPVNIIAGADISAALHDSLFFAAVILMKFPQMEIIEESYAVKEVNFPYIPGLLTFREGPALLKAFSQVKTKPDVVLFDGQGIAHPRGLGLASHLGLFLDVPTIGCAKTPLVGTFGNVGHSKGSVTPLVHEEQVVGMVVRTKDGIKPLFVSVGHKISLTRAVAVVLSSCRGYRLPEPVRRAHLAVNILRRKGIFSGG